MVAVGGYRRGHSATTNFGEIKSIPTGVGSRNGCGAKNSPGPTDSSEGRCAAPNNQRSIFSETKKVPLDPTTSWFLQTFERLLSFSTEVMRREQIPSSHSEIVVRKRKSD